MNWLEEAFDEKTSTRYAMTLPNVNVSMPVFSQSDAPAAPRGPGLIMPPGVGGTTPAAVTFADLMAGAPQAASTQ